VNESLAKYIKAFSKLRVAPTNGGAPHKPILLLSVLQMAQAGAILYGQVFITPELVAAFRSNWNVLVHTKHDCLMSLPFFHLKSEGFWQLVPKGGTIDINTMNAFSKSLVKLDAAIEYAQLNTDLAALIQNPHDNQLLQQAILHKYFPHHTIKDYLPKGQLEIFNDLTGRMLNEDPAVYKVEMERLLLQKDDEEVYLRGGLFKREIPKVYNFTCAISGMRIDATANISMIDACHIVPFAESHDDTVSNGIALCPTLHRAFDRGLISFSSDYRVLVSDHFTDDPGDYGIRQFEGKELLLPSNAHYYPRQENLGWHRGRFGFT